MFGAEIFNAVDFGDSREFREQSGRVQLLRRDALQVRIDFLQRPFLLLIEEDSKAIVDVFWQVGLVKVLQALFIVGNDAEAA